METLFKLTGDEALERELVDRKTLYFKDIPPEDNRRLDEVVLVVEKFQDEESYPLCLAGAEIEVPIRLMALKVMYGYAEPEDLYNEIKNYDIIVESFPLLGLSYALQERNQFDEICLCTMK